MYLQQVAMAKSTGDTCLVNLKSLSVPKTGELYRSLLESGAHSDVAFLVGDKEVKAYKGILSTYSPVFKAMFEADMKENSQGRVVIDDMTVTVIKGLLQFIYTDKIESLESLNS